MPVDNFTPTPDPTADAERRAADAERRAAYETAERHWTAKHARRVASADVLERMVADHRARSDRNLARFASDEAALRLRYVPARRRWETVTPYGTWYAIDRPKARDLLAQAGEDTCARFAGAAASDEYAERFAALASKLPDILNSYQSTRRLNGVLDALAGMDQLRHDPDTDGPREAALGWLGTATASGGFTPRPDLHAAYSEAVPAPLPRTRFYALVRDHLGPEVKRDGGTRGWRVTVNWDWP